MKKNIKKIYQESPKLCKASNKVYLKQVLIHSNPFQYLTVQVFMIKREYFQYAYITKVYDNVAEKLLKLKRRINYQEQSEIKGF